ncbi:DUF4166 domain-containing protein [Marinicrinis lubricantis]|uniref:DUF4166 domain-containing protein n=1 Tax=Marinicrinis lubricantis TaxID=2086470 RepID=A0ABW1IM43_9BACL
MVSIYQIALGDQFGRLHPKIQERFGISSSDRKASVGVGTMHRISYARWAALPLYVGTKRHMMFPNGGRNIPFSIENYPYRDPFGRETVTWIRTFKFPRTLRRFDATMIYSQERSRIVDYLGTHQHLAVDLELSAAPNGGIRIRSGEQRFYEGWLQFRFPYRLTGIAEVCEWYDDEAEKYRITVQVNHRTLGTIFAYEGEFEAVTIEVLNGHVPPGALPLRSERRE